MSFWSEQVLARAIDTVCAGRGPSRHREELVPRARGRVLDVGVGSGLNFPFVKRANVERWVGLDPSPALLERARERARAIRFSVELVEGVAERVPFDDASFDCVVVTYSFCSVTDPTAAASEIARVLRPGGQVLFAEHGVAERPRSRAIQRALDPTWSRIAGGCHLTRDFVRFLGDTGQFDVEDLAIRVREDVPAWMSTVRSGAVPKKG